MKTCKVATLDEKEIDFFSISEKDGPTLREWASTRLKAGLHKGLIIEYDISDEDVEQHIQDTLDRSNLVEVRPGTYDFISEEE